MEHSREQNVAPEGDDQSSERKDQGPASAQDTQEEDGKGNGGNDVTQGVQDANVDDHANDHDYRPPHLSKCLRLFAPA